MEKKKILIIDDDENFTKLVKLNLEDTGKYEVRTENKETNGLIAARAFKPDLILMDIVMPDMGGGKVARQIKEDESVKNIPIVFLTAHGSTIVGGPFITKPVAASDLKAKIEEVLKRRKVK